MAPFDTLDSDLDEIASRCTGDDAGVRRVAMLELADITDEGAVPLLIAGLADADGRCRSGGQVAGRAHAATASWRRW